MYYALRTTHYKGSPHAHYLRHHRDRRRWRRRCHGVSPGQRRAARAAAGTVPRGAQAREQPRGQPHHPLQPCRARVPSLAPDAFALWRTLEAESGADLVLETGSLDFGPADLPALQGRIDTMAELGYAAEVLDQTAMARRFPQFRFPADWLGFYQPNAGIVNADLAVATMAAQAVRHGAVLQEESHVRRVAPDGDGVVVDVDGPHGAQTFHAAQAVITAGPWAGRFFEQLGLTPRLSHPLKVTHQQVIFFDVAAHAQEMWLPDRCPVYICLPTPHFYGFPTFEAPGRIKIGLELDDDGVDPDTHPRELLQSAVDELCGLVEAHLVGIIPKAVDGVACLYTQSPDAEFIIDHHPEHPQIVFGAGFSGRGFKFTVLSGRLLADLSAAPGAYASPLWRDLFALRRFDSATPGHIAGLKM
ncbi:MAG: FAD-dependent oxidoreductase [Caldilineaceae bacterium]